MTMIARLSGLLGVLAIAAGPSPATARPIATPKVVSCAEGNCLLIRGHRASSQASIRVNDRQVAVGGGTSWQVRLPIAVVRDWSVPLARTLRVAIVGPAGSIERSEVVRLPVGLLGGTVELASLIVRAR